MLYRPGMVQHVPPAHNMKNEWVYTVVLVNDKGQETILRSQEVFESVSEAKAAMREKVKRGNSIL